MTTAILIPVLDRTHRIEPVLASIAAGTPEPHHVLFVASDYDEAMVAVLERLGVDYITCTGPEPGQYARKINAGFRATTEQFVFLAADDLHFHPGWLTAAIRQVRVGTGVVGTQDLANSRVLKGEHSTHSLVVRDYVDRFGTIDEPDKVLHEGYWHEYVDDELVGTAKHRNAWVFAGQSVVEHLHPMVGKAPRDALYDLQKLRTHRSRPLFMQRRPLWQG